MIQKEEILKALSTVKDPDLGRDLVSLNMIRDVEIEPSGLVSLRVVLTTPACPLKEKIESDVRAALSSISEIQELKIKMDSEVRNQKNHAMAPGQGGKKSNTIEGVKHIIAVSSGKGGVGKSTVAVNLAFGLAKTGAQVGLLDADIYGPNVPTMSGVSNSPQVTQHPEKGEIFIPPVAAERVKVMSMGFLVEPDQPMIWRGPMLHNILTQFCHKVHWGELDYLVIDMPPGTGDVQLSLAQLIPITGAVMVSTPQEVSLQDVRKAFRMWDHVKVPILGVVENMSYYQCGDCEKKEYLFGKGGGQSLAEKFQTQLLAELPIHAQVREGGDQGRPVVLGDQTAISARYEELAGKVAQRVSITDHQAKDPTEFVQIGRFS